MWNSLPENQTGLFKKSVSLSERKKKKTKTNAGNGEEVAQKIKTVQMSVMVES